MEKTVETVTQKVFDIDSRDDVLLFKSGEFEPVADMASFTARLSNDAKTILSVINAGLREYFRDQLRSNSDPWQIEDEDGKVSVFSGTTLNETQSKFLAGMVLNFAKMAGYSKDKTPAQKKALKAQAQENILAMPGFIESLKTPVETPKEVSA